MPVAMTVTVDGIEEMTRKLGKISPSANSAWMSRALVKSALLVQKIAAEDKIKRGGKGPPLARILTSRTGTLRRSIGVNRASLPFAVEVGTGLIYGAVHETGWSGTQHVPAHTRTVAFGRKVSPFRVNAFSRHVRYQARPFLAPALDAGAPKFQDFFGAEIAKELA